MRHGYNVRFVHGRLYVNRSRCSDFLDFDDKTYTIATAEVDTMPDVMFRRAFASGFKAGVHREVMKRKRRKLPRATPLDDLLEKLRVLHARSGSNAPLAVWIRAALDPLIQEERQKRHPAA
jgi:hypothetical protein